MGAKETPKTKTEEVKTEPKKQIKQEVKKIIETEENILTRNKKLINELCEIRDNYTFCLEVFERIGRRES
jgi:hypothetical protein